MIKGYSQIFLACLMLGVTVCSHALTIYGGNTYGTSYGDDISFSFRVDVDDAYAWTEGLNEPEVSNVSYSLWTTDTVSVSGGYNNIVGVLSLYESSTDAGTVFADSAADSWSFYGFIPITSNLGWTVSADQDQITVFGGTASATGDGFFLRDYDNSLLQFEYPNICLSSCFLSVPEPSAFLLMVLGLLGLGFYRQR